jgi:hypothetical protein
LALHNITTHPLFHSTQATERQREEERKRNGDRIKKERKEEENE